MPDSSFSSMDRRIALPAWRRRRVLLGGGAALAAAAIALFASTLPAAGTLAVPLRSVDMAVVRRAPFQDFVALRGEVVPMETYIVTAAAAGRVERIAAADGETVKSGATLATLANPDFALDVAGRQAEVSVRLSEANSLLINLNRSRSEREAQVADAAYALHKAELELEKREQLHRDGIVNDAYVKPYADEVDYQRARLAQLRQAQADETPVFAAQRRQIEASAADLKRDLRELKNGLAALTVAAPAAGRLTGFTLKPGQAVKAGDALGEVDSGDAFKLKAQVDEYFAARLKPGLKATAEIDGRSLPLSLSKIYRQVTDGRVTVEFQFSEAPPVLQPGQTMDVRLSLGDTAEALVVSNGPWLREGGGAYLFVVAADGAHADRREVAIGRRNPDEVEILRGLSSGERVITATRLDHTEARHLLLEKGNRE